MHSGDICEFELTMTLNDEIFKNNLSGTHHSELLIEMSNLLSFNVEINYEYLSGSLELSPIKI